MSQYTREEVIRKVENRESLERADLRGIDLEGANLEGISFIFADLREANLRRANLRNANLRGTILVRADLRDADLEGATMVGTDLTDTNLTGARMPSRQEGSFLDAVMTFGTTKKLFICMKVSNELDRMFEEKRVLYATYIQGGDPDSLKISTIDGTKFLGKVIDQGLPTEEVPDICRHIRSVVAKFCPNMRTSDALVKILVQEYIGQGIRHRFITSAPDLTGGCIRAVRRSSRHRRFKFQTSTMPIVPAWPEG